MRISLSLDEYNILLARPLTVHIPEVLTVARLLGEKLMDAAQSINEAIDRLAGVIETEAGEIAAMVMPGMSQAEVDAVTARLDALGDRVRGFAPTPPPEPLP